MPRLPTVTIHHPDNPQDRMVVNELDYDPTTMTLWDEENAPPAPPTPEERREAIKGAIRELMADGNEENFTQTGLPKVPALEGLLGYDIAAAERDAAWNEVQAE